MRYWLDEHLLEVYSVHQHGEGELKEKEMQKKQNAHRFIMRIEHHQYIRDDFFHQYSTRNEGTCSVHMKHHINKL